MPKDSELYKANLSEARRKYEMGFVMFLFGLPSASTCYNTLKLPTYNRAGTLRAKLLYAINAGFKPS
ncbi:hypothetical protein ABFX02_08G132500 [Erythranthe guttata]